MAEALRCVRWGELGVRLALVHGSALRIAGAVVPSGHVAMPLGAGTLCPL